ncbi:MAG: protein kinase [Pseudomonadota bacterium]
MAGSHENLAGSVLAGKYRLVHLVGGGGMGVVYEAVNLTINKRVAVKVMLSDISGDPGAIERFKREAAAAGSIGHPAICEVYDFVHDEEKNLLFIVMELLKGESLAALIEKHGSIPLRPAVDITLQILDGLEAAHEAGIIHRDLKPENVFLAKIPGSDGFTAKIMDFGISKFKTEGEDKKLTKSGAIIGSPYFMSPEQVKGLRDIDHRSDVYSAAALLFRMLSGKFPFNAETVSGIIVQIAIKPFPSLTEFNCAMPGQIEKVILKATAKEPGDRYSSASEMKEALLATGFCSGKKYVTNEDISGSGEERVAMVGEPAVFRDSPAAASSGSFDKTPVGRVLNSRVGLTSILVFLFVFNYAETQLESFIKSEAGYETGYRIASAFHGLEGDFSFIFHEFMNRWVVLGYSFSYFLLFPLMLLGVTIALAMRESLTPFRVFALAIAVNYLLALGFFLFFPVPERWAFPDSNAILLSDVLSTRLIAAIRPISGLDNCFPSLHVSFTVVMISTGYLFKFRLKNSFLFLGATIVLSTFVLGIHWCADIAAGIATGLLSVCLAVLADRAITKKRQTVLIKKKILNTEDIIDGYEGTMPMTPP